MVSASEMKVILFGIGGVGSWCAETLVRTGVTDLIVVDSDTVEASNLNRQLVALHSTLGRPKVEVMRQRLLDINPDAHITALQKRYDATTVDEFDFNQYDVVIDAIDSLDDKLLLIQRATESSARFLSSMGAARRRDPGQVAVAEFWQVKGCPLARALRNRIKKEKLFPKKKFLCVYSAEPAFPGSPVVPDIPGSPDIPRLPSLMTVTATFGIRLASMALQ